MPADAIGAGRQKKRVAHMLMDEPEFLARRLESHFRYPRDVLIILLLSVAIIVVKNAVAMPTAAFVMRRLGLDEWLSAAKRRKFSVSFWKMLFYIGTSVYGYAILRNETWIDRLDGFAETWGVANTPRRMLFYYYLEFSYYFVESFYLLGEHAYKDFWEMVSHHAITMHLIVASYHRDLLRYGVAIMAVHDISDPFLELSKLLNYAEDTALAIPTFVCFMTVFVVSRLCTYTFFVAVPAVHYIWRREFDWVLYSIVPMLCGLVVLHVIWSWMIVRLAVRIVWGKKPEDIRSIKTSVLDAQKSK